RTAAALVEEPHSHTRKTYSGRSTGDHAHKRYTYSATTRDTPQRLDSALYRVSSAGRGGASPRNTVHPRPERSPHAHLGRAILKSLLSPFRTSGNPPWSGTGTPARLWAPALCGSAAARRRSAMSFAKKTPKNPFAAAPDCRLILCFPHPSSAGY